MPPGLAPGRTARPAAILVVVGALLIVACAEHAPAARPQPAGAIHYTLTAEDGVELDAHLWDVQPGRIAIYLHEYREDQTAWWPRRIEHPEKPLSALTLDLRGHGESEGLPDDFAGMVLDAHAAVQFARERGYQDVVLIGAGMGAAVAIIAAAEDPSLRVVGLSAPAEFDVLQPLAVADDVRERVALAATRQDLSAAWSITQFREAGVDTAHAAIYPGRAHGARMLDGRAGADVRAFVERALDRLLKD